jgi:SPX domain protein involved in polyphosphate accumulation
MKSTSKDRGPDHGFWNRYELKYLINESKAAAIEQFIEPYVRLDYYCQIQPSGSYPVVSLYLDSDNLRLCRESLHGHKNRFKLRIRSYTDEPDYPNFLEIKRRANTVIMKSRAEVRPCNVAPLLTHRLLNPQSNGSNGETIKQFMLYMNSISGGPVIRTRYKRQAFEDIVDERVRITFDRNLCYKITPIADVSLNGTGWQQMLLNKVVLEIKFTSRYPPWLSQMVKYFDLRKQSLSKYARSIKRAIALGFCAPEIPR